MTFLVLFDDSRCSHLYLIISGKCDVYFHEV